MPTRKSVKIISSRLHEVENGDLVLQGVVSLDSLDLLKVDDYQRGVMSGTKAKNLVQGYKEGGIPNIVLGMRGHCVRDTDGTCFLKDDVYIIDGLQRVSAAKRVLKEGGKPTVYATIHFGTDKKSECEQFQKLHSGQLHLSPNVFIRNMRDTHPAIGALHTLTMDKSFVLHGRVCWNQRRKSSDLITARTYLRVVGHLHAHIGPGKSTNTNDMADALGKIMNEVGRNTFRKNIKTFFDVVDQCWGVRAIAYTDSVSWLKANFLKTLATLFSKHELFWVGHSFKVDCNFIRKLKSFKVHDPTVVQLSSSNNKAAVLLYDFLLGHINSGKRTHRLVERQPRKRGVPTKPSTYV